MDTKTVAYTRSWEGNDSNYVQRHLITRFCRFTGASFSTIYTDLKKRKIHADEWKRGQMLGIQRRKDCSIFSALDKLIADILSDKVGVILVDTILRLYGTNENEQQLIKRILKEKEVTVIEVARCPIQVPNSGEQPSYGIYHSSAGVKSTTIVLKQLDELYLHAQNQGGIINQVIVDHTYDSSKRIELEKMVSGENIDSLLVWKAASLAVKIGPFMTMTRFMKKEGIRLVSYKEDEISISNIVNFKEQPFRVAVCSNVYEKNNLFEERARLYCREKTNWEIISHIVVDMSHGENGIYQAIEEAEQKPELLIIDTIETLSAMRSTASFFRVKQNISIPIMILREEEVLT